MAFLEFLTIPLISKAEKRLGVGLDYVRNIAKTDFGLLNRYNRIFGMIDPCKHVPHAAYHTARIRAALAADCGTCVEAEINQAKQSGLDGTLVEQIIMGQITDETLQAVQSLTDAVIRDRMDAPEARDSLIASYGIKGLIELSLAMNGAAVLPGVKRAMGYATACDIDLMRRLSQ